MALTTREIAVLVWVGVLAAWAMTRPDFRRAVGGLMKAALFWKFPVALAVLILYTSAIVWLSWGVGFWKADLLKDTIVWFAFSGIGFVFSRFSGDGELPTWRSVLAGQVGAVVVVEYVVNSFTLPIWAELLLVPVLFFLGAVGAVAGSQERLAPVSKLAGCSIGVIGLAMLVLAVRGAVLAASSLSAWGVLRELLLPLVLTVGLLPMSYLAFLLSAYEQLGFALRYPKGQRSVEVIRYAKRQVVRRLWARPRAVWTLLHTERGALMATTTRGDVDRVLDRVLGQEAGLAAGG